MSPENKKIFGKKKILKKKTTQVIVAPIFHCCPTNNMYFIKTNKFLRHVSTKLHQGLYLLKVQSAILMLSFVIFWS